MSIKIGGCASVTVKKYFNYLFLEGSVVYFIPKARKGILEPHAIKEVILKVQNGNDVWPIFLYKDSFNAYFNENELCSQADAIQYAKDYFTVQAYNLQNALQAECQ
jgi:hypothetical protein